METIENIRLVDYIDFMYDSTEKLLELKSIIDSKILTDNVVNNAKKNLEESDFNWLVDRNNELKRVSDYIKSIKETEDEEERLRRAASKDKTDDLPF